MELLLELGTQQLDHLRKVFLQNDGLDIGEFVNCMLELLPQRYIGPEALVKTVSSLQDAFAQVDVNGDGNMSWEEMMAALIDAGSPQLNKALRNPFSFVEKEVFASNTRHSMQISRVRYIPELQMLAACEEGRRYVVLYDASPRKDVGEGYPRVCEIDSFVMGETEGGDVFDIAYMPEQNAFMLSTSDFSIQFWDARPLSKYLVSPPPAVPVSMAAAAREEADSRVNSAGSRRGDKSGGMPKVSFEGAPKGRERKPLPPMPEKTASLAPARAGDKDKPKAKAGPGKAAPGNAAGEGSDEEDEGDIIADDPALGPENTKTGIKAYSTDPTKDGCLFITKVHTPTPIRLLCWVPAAQKLLAATSGADIMVWHVFMQRVGYTSWDLRVALRGLLSVHQKVVTDMVFLRDVGLVASASLDHTLALWGVRGLPDGVGGRRGFSDSPTYKPGYIQKLPKGCASAGVFLVGHHKHVHSRGIRSLLYAPSVRLLFSSGYEPFIQVWDMAMEDGTPTYKLNGHSEGIVGMTSLEPHDMKFEVKTAVAVQGASAGANADLAILKKRQVHYAQIVTVDEAGEFRWWDCARDTSIGDDDRCFQSWYPMSTYGNNQKYHTVGIICTRFPPRPNKRLEAPGDSEDNNNMSAVVKQAAKGPAISNGAVVLGIGSRIKCFEAVRQDDDRAVPAAGLYHDVTMAFVAVTQQDIRFFDANNGLMTRVYRGALPSEAANNCITFDARRRKLLVGCNGGSILCINTFNCRVMKALPRHGVDVSGLVYCDEDSTVISTGWDGRLHITDETITEMDGERVGLMRRVRRSHGPSIPITALAFDHALSLIATAGGNGSIRLWDYQDVSFVGEVLGHDAEITSMAFVSPWPVLVSADLLGVVNVWLVTRGDGLTCLASMSHRPVSNDTPPPSSSVQEAQAYHAELAKARMGAYFGMAARRLHAKVTGADSPKAEGSPAAAPASPAKTSPTNFSLGSGSPGRQASPTRLGQPQAAPPAPSSPTKSTSTASGGLSIKAPSPLKDSASSRKLLSPSSPCKQGGNPFRTLLFVPVGTREETKQSVQDPVTAMAVIPPTDTLADSLQNTAGLHIKAEDGGADMVAGAGDVARKYPTLVLGDENGRVSLWDMGHVLGPLALELKKEPSTPASPLMPGVEKEGLGASLVTDSQAEAAVTTMGSPSVGEDGSSVIIPLRRPIEQLAEGKMPANIPSYHPRKIIKRSGPKAAAAPTAVPNLPADQLAIIEEITEHREEVVGKGLNRMMSKSNMQATGSRGGAGGVADPGASYAQRAGTSNRTQRRAKAPVKAAKSGGYDSDGRDDAPSSDDEGAPAGLDGGSSLSPPRGGLIQQDKARMSRPSTRTNAQAGAAPADDGGVTKFPSVFGNSDPNNPDDVESVAPSRSLPALARVVGDAWKPSALTYVHGIFYDASLTDDPTADAKSKGKKKVDIRGAVNNGARSGWKGFPIRSVRLVRTAELVCLISASEDGTLRALDLRGKALAAVPVASGRRGVDTAGPAGGGKNMVSAMAQSVEWKVKLDCTLRDRVLTEHAEECLAELKVAQEKAAAVAAAIAAGNNAAVEYSELKEYERRMRRTSVVAASDFLEPAEAKRKAQQIAMHHAVESEVEHGLAGQSRERARVIGQLFGAANWKKTAVEQAQDEALQQARRQQGRRNSVAAQVSKTLGISLLDVEAEKRQAKADEADFSGPLKEGQAITAPPRAGEADYDMGPASRPSARPSSGGTSSRPMTTADRHALQAAFIGRQAAEERAKLMDALMTDPSVKTLVELAQADAEERQSEMLRHKGRKKRLDVIGLSGSTTGQAGAAKPGSALALTAFEGDLQDDEDCEDPDAAIEFDVEKMLATLTPGEKRLRQVRAIAARAGTDNAGRVYVNGVPLQDPAKAAQAAIANAKEALLYPSFHAESHRPSTFQLIQASLKEQAKSMPVSTSDERYVSPFLANKMKDLELEKARKAKADEKAKGKAAIAMAATNAIAMAAAAAAANSPTAAGGGKAAIASLLKQKSGGLTGTAGGAAAPAPSAASAKAAAAAAALESALSVALNNEPVGRDKVKDGAANALKSLPAGSRMTALRSVLDDVFASGANSRRDSTVSGVGHGVDGNGRKVKTVSQLLKERNPELMTKLDGIKERKRRGSILVSMSDTAVQEVVGKAAAAEVKAEAQARQRRASFLVQRQQALDAMAAQKDATQAAAAAAGVNVPSAAQAPPPGLLGLVMTGSRPSDSKDKDKDKKSPRSPTRAGSPKSKSPRRGGVYRGKGKLAMLEIDAEDALTPEQFYLLSKRNRVGGHLRRDVLAFQELVAAADKNGDGQIGYEEFTGFIESGASGMRHLKSHLESLFRSADKSGDGSLSIPELASIMFPKAMTEQLKEIVLFTTYKGPPPAEVVKDNTKIYSEETLRQLRELFNMYDADGGGTIDRSEMAAAMAAMGVSSSGMGGGAGGPVSFAAQEEARDMMAEVDESGDGEVDFDEFVRLMGPAFEPDS